MPMIHLKAVFDTNYSRKLSSLRNRLVLLNERREQHHQQQDLAHNNDDSFGATQQQGGGSMNRGMVRYWRWAFESPHEVKVLVRKVLGEENNAPATGHLRLVLLPVVYNALSQQADSRRLNLFKSLHLAMKHSTYFSIVKRPLPEDERMIEHEMGPGERLFSGPADIRLSMEKYMKNYQ